MYLSVMQIIDKVINDNWDYFYSIENKSYQDIRIQTLIENHEIKRRRKKMAEKEEENHNDVSFNRCNSLMMC